MKSDKDGLEIKKKIYLSFPLQLLKFNRMSENSVFKRMRRLSYTRAEKSVVKRISTAVKITCKRKSD